jgi:serine/threonine-protein kinase
MNVPERIGKYAVSEVLGRGAMGVVYKGFDPHIHRPVAIKVIHQALLDGDGAEDSIVARFRNEAQAVGRIAHPGVVAIHEFGEDAGKAYIVMEFVAGRNLDHVLAGTPMLDDAQVLRIVDQLLDALAVAHAAGVWHRDIKPANLLLTASGQVKLTDFGIARIEHAGLTQVASTIGTPGYMAPEQYMGEGVDHRADLFACGVLLHRLLTGQPAFSGTAEVVMYKVLNEQAALPSVASGGRRHPAYNAVVARAMAKAPGQRFGSAQEMRQALLDAARSAAANADATVIVSPEHWARAVETAVQASRLATGASSQASQAGASGWDPVELSRVERALASHIGPLAKIMVRKAASSCSDVASLAAAVATHIPQAAEREKFMSAATAGSQALPASGHSGGTMQAQPAAPGPASPTALHPSMGQPVALSEDFKARAMQAMVRRMGPIARVLVKRAAEQSQGDQQRFIALLMANTTEADRAEIGRDLAALG